MKVTALWAALLATPSVFADTVSASYVCTDASGRKAIQDYPCPESHQQRELPTVRHNPTFSEALDRFQQQSQHRQDRSLCEMRRRSPNVSDRRWAAENCSWAEPK